jgi:hypothetical protein
MNQRTEENTVSLKPSGSNGLSPPRPRRPKKTGGPNLARERSTEARKQAAAILEVLAGARTPTQAAAALAVSLPRYYQLEQRALEGLLAACEPCRHRGRVRTEASVAARLRKENERLQRELGRQQALVRLVQRNVGLAPPAPAAKDKEAGKKRRRRRPVARALAVAQRLQQESAAATPAAVPEPSGV